ncbi:MAG: PAS domain-containing protein, partial [Candidatus Sulfotelmatobacter sp.]
MASRPQATSWLTENGPKELELLFQAVLFHPSAPILIADNDRRYRDASSGVSKLLGLPREKIIGRKLDDFAPPSFKPVLSERWRAFLEEGQQEGTLQLVGPDGGPREVEYLAKGNILPVRHLLVLRDKSPDTSGLPAEIDKDPAPNIVPAWVQDYALFLLDPGGRVEAWYAGAERIYGYKSGDVAGQHVSMFYADADSLRVKLDTEFKRAAGEGHVGSEGWHVKKDRSRFWANVITMALKDDKGELQGFARVVRDFSDRHQRDEKLRRTRAHIRPLPAESTIAGIVSGEFDRI